MFQNQTFGQLDYLIVITFIKKFLEYYVGSEVVLSNNQKAKIISLNIFEITKPLLVTFDGEFIDISKNRNVKIIDFSEKFSILFSDRFGEKTEKEKKKLINIFNKK